MQKKILNIVFLRGMAALMVCIVHLQFATKLHLNDFFDKLINHGQLGVQVFFIISGFIIPYSLYRSNYSTKNFFPFLLKRSLRIDPPVWINIIILLLITSKFTQNLNIINLFANIFYLVPFIHGTSWYNDIFWTLGIEFQFYIIIGLLFPLLTNLHIKYSFSVLVLVFVLTTLLPFGEARLYIYDNLPFFIIGFVTFLIYIKQLSKYFGLIVLICFSLWLCKFVAIRFGIISFITITTILFFPPINLKITNFLGNISYSLYLTHTLVISFVSLFIPEIFLLKSYYSFFLIFFMIVISSYILHLVIEIPAMNLSRKFKSKKD